MLDITDSSGSEEILNLLAKNYMKLKEYETAANIFHKLSHEYPENHLLLCDLARCEIKLGKLDHAKEHIKKALMIFPDFEEGIKLLKEVQNNE